MPVDNRLNPERGRTFEALSADLLSARFNVPFQVNVPIPIGHPAKAHKFDLVSKDKRYVGECKNHTWTETGNIPSAKMTFLNEAVLYLSLIPFPTERFLVMPRSVHTRRTENLAAYYFRTYQHLLNGIFIIEVAVETGEITELGRNLQRKESTDMPAKETYWIEPYTARANGRPMVRAVSTHTRKTLQVKYPRLERDDWTAYGALEYIGRNETFEEAADRLREGIARWDSEHLYEEVVKEMTFMDV